MHRNDCSWRNCRVPAPSASWRFLPVQRADLEGQQRVDCASSPIRPRMAASCAKRPFVMARQTSLHHCSNQTRNRHGWRCLAERKLRLRVRQYGERYLWFESISLHHAVPANRRDFRVDRNPRNSGRLVRRVAVCEPNSGRSPAFCARNRPPVSARKIPFRGPRDVGSQVSDRGSSAIACALFIKTADGGSVSAKRVNKDAALAKSPARQRARPSQ